MRRRPSRAEVELAKGVLAPWRWITSPRFFHIERVPRDRPVLLVGNHTLMGLLDIPLMVRDASNTEAQRTAFTYSVDYRHGTTTGISAADRAATIQSLIRLNRAEFDLRDRAEQLLEASRRKDEFLAMLAHELRNPLSAISACLPLLTQQAATNEREARAREIVERQVLHLGKLVDDGGKLAAGAAPGGAEVDKDGFVGLDDFRVKRRIAELRCAGHDASPCS